MVDNEFALETVNLRVWFPIRGGLLGRVKSYVKAVDSVTLRLPEKGSVGLVGESGSGKTTLAKTLVRLIKPYDGKIIYDGVDITKLSARNLKPFRKKVQMVFQDPYASLDPRQRILSLLVEPMRVHRIYKDGSEIRRRAQELLEMVGLDQEHLLRFPHEFSGGQRQRIAIARALSVNPSVLILDEPTSSLDVSVQAQILNLLKDLRQKLGITYLFISHNLSVIGHMCEYVYVMYLGRIVEAGPTIEVFRRPAHPYTQILLSSIPPVDPTKKVEPPPIEGDPPSPSNVPSGCRFRLRCPYAQEICSRLEPNDVEVAPRHFSNCHYAEDVQKSFVNTVSFI